jgi:hypothetical protein
MMITKGILHILDFNGGMALLSQTEIDFSQGEIDVYLDKHLQRVVDDGANKPGIFYESSDFKLRLQKYLNEEMDFVEFSHFIGHKLYDSLGQSDKTTTVDVVVLEYLADDTRCLGVLLLTNRTAYTHQADNVDGKLSNQFIRHFAILPSMSQKVDAYALINCEDYSIQFFDRKVSIDGDEVFILPEMLLQCSSQVSPKEAIKAVKKTIAQVTSDYGANSAVALSKAKSYLMESAEETESFSPVELGKQVFADSPAMQQAYTDQLSEAKMPPAVAVEKKVAVQAGKNHKIKTDTGIEVTFPAEYFANHDFIEFINNPDGTISIELKNIGKIENK